MQVSGARVNTGRKCLPQIVLRGIVTVFRVGVSGCSAVWLARFVRVEEVVGSNPTSPTTSYFQIKGGISLISKEMNGNFRGHFLDAEKLFFYAGVVPRMSTLQRTRRMRGQAMVEAMLVAAILVSVMLTFGLLVNGFMNHAYRSLRLISMEYP